MTELPKNTGDIKPLHVYKSKFFYLLVSLIIFFLATSPLDGGTYHAFILNSLFSFLILFSIYTISHRPIIKLLTIFLALVILTIHWLLFLNIYDHNLHIISDTLTILFLCFVSYTVLANVTQHHQITADSLFGAICGYFLLGLTWTFIYILIELLNPHAFNVQLVTTSVHENIQHFFYFSFCTMTTLGYGDILPVSNIARTFAWLEALIGQVYLAVWISQLVGLRIAQRNGNISTEVNSKC